MPTSLRFAAPRDAPILGRVAVTEVLRGAILSAHLGYWIDAGQEGKGLMTEAVRAVVACGHEVFRLNRIDAWTLPGNAASDRVLEKAGFRHEGTLRQKAWFKGAFHDFRMFGRIAGDATNPK